MYETHHVPTIIYTSFRAIRTTALYSGHFQSRSKAFKFQTHLIHGYSTYLCLVYSFEKNSIALRTTWAQGLKSNPPNSYLNKYKQYLSVETIPTIQYYIHLRLGPT
uniref:Uncharacterized protein n=1 Tax=Cacopsylla melanoneura TaxID=428564 RepID=A0A8D8R8N3_9HEMI